MKKLICLSLTFLIFSNVSCQGKKSILKRYKKVDYADMPTGDTPKVGVSGYALATDKSEDTKNLLNLTDRGQAALISAIAAKEKDSKSIIEGASADLKAAKEPTRIVDKTKFKRKIVLSATNLSHHPGDRISKLKISLKTPDSTNVVFKNWNQITSQFQTIDIGKATYGRTRSLSVAPEVKVNDAISLGASFSNETAITQEANLKQRIVVLSGSLTKGSATLFQEGCDGQDLSGNIIADIDLEFTNVANTEIFSFSKLFTASKAARTDSAAIDSYILRYPNVNTAITADISYSYQFREINKGGATMTESDDEITLVSQTKISVQNFTILEVRDYRPNTWSIRDPGAGGGLVQVRRRGYTAATILTFDTYAEAEKVMLWLKATANPVINGHHFQISNTDLTAAQYSALEIVLN